MKKQFFKRAAVILPLIILVFSFSFAGGGEDEAQSSAVNFHGKWRTNWGTELIVDLRQRGNMVIGRYRYTDRGYPVAGRLRGTISGRRLNFVWRERIAGRTRGGHGYYVMSEDNNSFTGRWGNGSSNSSGGAWNGTRM